MPSSAPFTSTFKSDFSHHWIPRSTRCDLEWWITYSSSWNGIHFVAPTRPVIHIYTDASGTKGAGGILNSSWFSIRIPQRYCKHDIKWKEFYAVIHAILCWGPEFCHKHIIFHTNNTNVYSAIKELSIQSSPMMELVHQFLGLASILDFTFTPNWIPTEHNTLADAASQFQFNLLFSLAPYLSCKPSPKVLSLKCLSKPIHSRPPITLSLWQCLFPLAASWFASPSPLAFQGCVFLACVCCHGCLDSKISAPMAVAGHPL